MDAKKIYEMLMGSKFEHWYNEDFMDHVEGEEGAKSKEEIIKDLEEML